MTNIFVYGTLRPSLYERRRPEGKNVRMATCRTNLQMYNLGSFPALVETEDDHLIVGETFEIPDPDRRGGLIYDSYEGYTPDGGGLYDRKQVEVTAEDGEVLTAWVYFQHKGRGGYGQRNVVESNDWADVVGKRFAGAAR